MPKQPHFHAWSGWIGEGCRQSDSGFRQALEMDLAHLGLPTMHMRASPSVLNLGALHCLQDRLGSQLSVQGLSDLVSAKPPSLLTLPTSYTDLLQFY